jgi:hypothetical protein
MQVEGVNATDSNRVGLFAAENGAGPKGAMGAASKGIATRNKDYPGPNEMYHVSVSP